MLCLQFSVGASQLAHCTCEIFIINNNACKPLEMDIPYKFPHLRHVSTDKYVAPIVQSPVIRKVINANAILGDPGAASRVEGIFVGESLLQEVLVLSPTKIRSTRQAAPGSSRMR